MKPNDFDLAFMLFDKDNKMMTVEETLTLAAP